VDSLDHCSGRGDHLASPMLDLLQLHSKEVRISTSTGPITGSCSSIRRSPHRHHRKISRRPTRRIDVLAREQEHYLRPSISSLAFDGPYAESISSSNDDHQRISNRTISPVPELQVRRLSEQDWPHFAMHNPYGLPAFLSESPSQSTSSTRPL
jgi:hypothetical protein